MLIAVALVLTLRLSGQTPCGNTPVYSPCDITLDLDPTVAAQHPNPHLTADLWVEIRSPEYKTYRLPAFWDGGRRMAFRFTPTLIGEYTYRITGNIPSLDGKIDKFMAIADAASTTTAFIRRANVHHWQYTEARKPHLYMGADDDGASPPEAYAAAKFSHVAVRLFAPNAWSNPDTPDPAFYKKLDARLLAFHSLGITVDLVLAPTPNHLTKAFPSWQQRQRFLRFLAARYTALNATWQLVDVWETSPNAKTLLKEIGLEIKKLDPCEHPRSTRARDSSAPLGPDGWMDFVVYGSGRDPLIAVEHQSNTVPQVALLDASLPPDDFRKLLWNATMSGAYPALSGPVPPTSPNAKTMTGWFTFMHARVRHWDIEPYFDLDGGRAIAIPGVLNDDYDIGAAEFLVYVEHPQKVSVTVRKHTYDVYWVNPSTGEFTKEKKDWKGDLFEGTPPDATRDWILHLSRDGYKEAMLKGSTFVSVVKFDSWPIPIQEPERNAAKAPFELIAPTINDTLTAGQPAKFEIKLKRQTGGTRRMTYVLTGENVRDGQGTRFLASGSSGTFTIDPLTVTSGPGVVNLRLAVLNAPGKLYILDYVIPVKPAR